MSNTLDTNVNMRSASHATSEQVDVVIIGAGLAGLTAARDVIKSGLSCIILEARDRVGGKTWSQQLPDGKGTVDLGAAWINDVNQTRVYALAKQYNAEMIEQNTAGNCAIQGASGTISSFPYGELPSVSLPLPCYPGLRADQTSSMLRQRKMLHGSAICARQIARPWIRSTLTIRPLTR